MRLAIVCTHPVQYNAPWFKLLSDSKVDLKVFYTWSQSQLPQYDTGFKRVISWDIPLLEGYEYEFVENKSTNPGLHHYKGIITPGLIPAIDSFSPDALLILGWNFQSHFTIMRHFKGQIPVWFRGDSTLLDDNFGLKMLARRLFLLVVYRYIDKAFYVGSENKRYFKALGLSEKQLEFAPHAIDNNRFQGQRDEYKIASETWRISLGIGREKFVVLYAGKFEKKKDPHFILKLANQLMSDDFRFLMVGNGEMEDEIKALAVSDKRILFLPFQNQKMMPALYRMGDVFILPSEGPGETWGLALNEAMACGLPVVASEKVGGAYDLVDDTNGLRFKKNNITEVVNFIEKLKSFPELKMEMGNNSQKKINAFSFSEIVDSIMDNLRTLNPVI